VNVEREREMVYVARERLGKNGIFQQLIFRHLEKAALACLCLADEYPETGVRCCACIRKHAMWRARSAASGRGVHGRGGRSNVREIKVVNKSGGSRHRVVRD
jgi:hypothetical protein